MRPKELAGSYCSVVMTMNPICDVSDGSPVHANPPNVASLPCIIGPARLRVP
eukprot:m.181086 g.181086  ORF g.181086 m.181086 type:complete len:52 (+) comp24582_c0_seq2:5595-5750(+)